MFKLKFGFYDVNRLAKRGRCLNKSVGFIERQLRLIFGPSRQNA